MDLKPTRNKLSFCSSLTKNCSPHILILYGMSLDFDYLGKFELIFGPIEGMS
jgi:hypothetical protein